jgi:hypothetical protein
MVKVIRGKKGAPPPRKLRTFRLGAGLPDIKKLMAELDEMRDVLLGREEPPVTGVLALMEVADAYYARSAEIEMLILRLERDPISPISRSHPLYKFRTGELRSFKEMCSKAADLGSRRLTVENMRNEKERLGRESHGG